MPPHLPNHNPPERCRQCGTCCRKGGPALHEQDRTLVESGRLPLSALETLRRGQWVQDNVKGELIRLESEIIKIKSTAGKSECLFLGPARTCGIYPQRPLECRVLQCWNPAPLTKIYDQERLTRADLISGIPSLWDLVQAHEARCDYHRIHTLIETLRKPDPPPESSTKLGEIVTYDAQLRILVAEKAPHLEDCSDFLLGPPLTISLLPLGLRITPTPSGWQIRDNSASAPQTGTPVG